MKTSCTRAKTTWIVPTHTLAKGLLGRKSGEATPKTWSYESPEPATGLGPKFDRNGHVGLRTTRAIDKFNPTLIREKLTFGAYPPPWCIRPYKASPCAACRLHSIFCRTQRYEFTNVTQEGFTTSGKLVGSLLPIDQSILGKKTFSPGQDKVSHALRIIH
jgi:hypothetical protein